VESGLAGAGGTLLTRVHGDLHVGQVLRWDGGYAVSDFDGNPVLPAAERDLPQPPARDVAGMLRAIDHVGRIVDRRTEHTEADRVRTWAASARQDFLAVYRTTTQGCGHGGLLDDGLLPAFEVEQECRELVYAARHLPQWTYVPDAALVDLLPPQGQDTG
jgi:maltokinase